MKQSLLKLAFAAVMLMLVAPFAGSQAVAQTHNLTGTVVDAQGNPVAGAAVVIDGTTKGYLDGFRRFLRTERRYGEPEPPGDIHRL